MAAYAVSNEQLAALSRAGDRDALEQLWTQVERFVSLKASDYLAADSGKAAVTADDLIQVGFLAVRAAVQTFDPDRGKSFVGYLAEFQLPKAFRRACGYDSSDPLESAVSLDAPIGADDEDSKTIADLLPDPTDPMEAVEDAVWSLQLHVDLEDAMTDDLNGRQHRVLSGQYFDGLTQVEIADLEKVSSSRIGQDSKRALRLLRDGSHRRTLAAYLDSRVSPYVGTGLGTFLHSGSSVENAALRREWLTAQYNRRERRAQRGRVIS